MTKKYPLLAIIFLSIIAIPVLAAQSDDGRQMVDVANRILPGPGEPGLQPPVGFTNQESTENAGIFYAYVIYPDASHDGVGIGDFNQDGLNDVATSNANSMRILLQNINGYLDPSVLYPAGGRSETLSVGDLNNDGRDDVVTGNFTSDTVGVYLQQANGTMAPRSTYSTSNGPDAIVVGDLNNSGRDDIAVANWLSTNINVFYQSSNGNLPRTNYSSPQAGYDDIDIGDFNNDGLLDIAKMNGQGLNPDLSVYLQNNSGTMDGPFSYSAGSLPGGVGTGDVTGDGLTDIVLTTGGNQPSAKLRVFAQTVTGTLVLQSTYNTYDVPQSLEVEDVNMDGLLDVIIVHGGWQRISVFLQQPGGTLAPYQLYLIPYASSYGPQGMDVGDINNDTAPDVALGDYNHGLVVLYNALPAFRVAAYPSTLTVVPGGTITGNVTIDPFNGFSAPVNLSLDGLPPGVNYYFSPNPAYPGDQITFDLMLDPSVPIGTYSLTVQGTSGTLTRTASITMEVAEVAISGLTAESSSPTILGSTTFFTATITTGTNVSYTWSFGDGDFGSGPTVTHIYPAAGVYTAIVTATNTTNTLSFSLPVSITLPVYINYLPAIQKP